MTNLKQVGVCNTVIIIVLNVYSKRALSALFDSPMSVIDSPCKQICIPI